MALRYLADFTKPSTIQTSGVNGIFCSRSGVNSYSVNQAGQLIYDPANTLRFRSIFDDKTQSYYNGLLVEPAATNLLLYSEPSGWSNTGYVYTQNLTLTTGVYQFSVILTSSVGDGMFPTFMLNSVSQTDGRDLGQFSYGSLFCAKVSYDITIVGTQTCTFTLTTSSTTSFTLAQVEAGSQPTSSIPTAGSTATRNADVIYIDLYQSGYQNWFNKNQGTFLFAGCANLLTVKENCVYLRNVAGTGDLLNLGISRNPTLAQTAAINSYTDYTFFAACDNPGQQFINGMSYRSAQQFTALNGRFPLTPSTQTAAFDFSTCNRLWIGSEAGSSNFFNGIITRLSYYDAAFSQQDLIMNTK